MMPLARELSERAAAGDREALLAAFEVALVELARLAPTDEAHRRSLLAISAVLRSSGRATTNGT
jgi:hypothetical protein